MLGVVRDFTESPLRREGAHGTFCAAAVSAVSARIAAHSAHSGKLASNDAQLHADLKFLTHLRLTIFHRDVAQFRNFRSAHTNFLEPSLVNRS